MLYYIFFKLMKMEIYLYQKMKLAHLRILFWIKINILIIIIKIIHIKWVYHLILIMET